MSRRFSKNTVKDKRKKKLANKLRKKVERKKKLEHRLATTGTRFSKSTITGILGQMALGFRK